ncbi:MAG: hypothetical protein HY901_11465 [Deltaproteobacteria bacterium]|nr:hypothetical protein [Deltaproteobacteria bacterium]
MVRTALPLFAVLVAVSGCAASRGSSKPILLAAEETVAPAPAPLDRSLFVPRGESGLSEADLARILDAPLDLKLPARVGVAALGQAFCPSAPTTLDAGIAATHALAESLEGSPLVTVASEMATEIPTGGGVEGLRELAARYRTPYLLLYSERFEDRTHANGLAALWFTVLGGLLTPSQTVQGAGLLSVSLLDVRTGTLLFTIHQGVAFEEMHLPLRAGAAFRDLRRKAADEAAKALASRVLEKFQRLAREEETEERGVGG